MRSFPLVLPALCLSLVGALATLALAGPADTGTDTLRGSGKVASSLRSVPAFRGITLEGSVDLELRIGSPQRVEIIADDNVLPHVTTTVTDGSLIVGLAKQRLTTRNAIRAVVVAPALDALAIRGSGDAELDGIDSASFAVSVRGSGDVSVRGKARSVAVQIDGSGDVDAKALVAESAAVKVNGSGDVDAHATRSFAATVNGSGSIVVHGRPRSVARRVNGSGSIRVL